MEFELKKQIFISIKFLIRTSFKQITNLHPFKLIHEFLKHSCLNLWKVLNS